MHNDHSTNIEKLSDLRVAIEQLSELVFSPKPDQLGMLADGQHSAVQFLGKHLGCEVSRWFFYDREGDDIKEFRQRVRDGIDPAWLEVEEREGGEAFFFRILEREEKERLRDTVERAKDGPKSVQRYYRWFLNASWLRSISEEREGWIFVDHGEMLAGCFEWLLCEAIVEELDSGARFKDIRRKTLAHDADGLRSLSNHPSVSEIADAVAEKMSSSVARNDGEGNRSLGQIKSWILELLKSDPQGSPVVRNHTMWFGETLSPAFNQEKEESKPWFVRLGQIRSDALDRVRTWCDLAKLVIQYGEYDFRTPESSRSTIEKVKRLLRFSPSCEIELKSRNLVFFPLWLGRNHDRRNKLQTPFTAFVIASFYDSETVRDNASLIRTIFTSMALPNVIEFAADAYETRFLFRAVGHDIRHPLFEALNFMRIALDELPEAEAHIRQYLEWAEDSTENAMLRADNMLDAIRIREIVAEPCSISQILTEIVEKIRLVCKVAGYKVIPRLERIQDDTLATAIIDKDKIRRCIYNIILNAVEASPAGHEVRVSMSVLDGSCIVTIGNNGLGMSPEAMQAFHEGRMFTTKPRGSGIGLLSARNILRAHKGTMEFVEQKEPGCCIRISIPLSPHDKGSDI